MTTSLLPLISIVLLEEPTSRRGFFALREEDGEGAVFAECPVTQRFSVLSGGEEHMQAARNSVCLAVIDELQRRAAAGLLVRMSMPEGKNSATAAVGMEAYQHARRLALLQRWSQSASSKWVVV